MSERDPSAQLPAGVGATALTVARARAVESRRADRLFDDPFAAQFLQAAGQTLDGGAGHEAVAAAGAGQAIDIRPFHDAYIPIRTRFFDDVLLDAGRAGCRQVVILAAGLDARAFRLTWPAGTQLYELDLPDVFAFEERVLAANGAMPACARTVLPVDLRGDWPPSLLAAGFQPQEASAWLIEGLLMYLNEAERDRLLDQIVSLSNAQSRMALEPPVWNIPASLLASIARGVIEVSALAQSMAGVQTEQADASIANCVAWLAGHGWRGQLFDIRELFARYGRAVPPALEQFLEALPRPLASAERSR